MVDPTAERLNAGLAVLMADLWVELMVDYWVGQWAALDAVIRRLACWVGDDG